MTKAQKRAAAREYQRKWYYKNKAKKSLQVLQKKFEPNPNPPLPVEFTAHNDTITDNVREYDVNYCPHCGVHLGKIELY